MAIVLAKVERAFYANLNVIGDYLEDKIAALYKISKERGITSFGYLGPLDSNGYPDISDNEDENVSDFTWEDFNKWLFTFAEINDEYVHRSQVIQGIAYSLEEKYINVDRYQDHWDGVVYADCNYEVYPHAVQNMGPLMELLRCIAKELDVDIDAI